MKSSLLMRAGGMFVVLSLALSFFEVQAKPIRLREPVFQGRTSVVTSASPARTAAIGNPASPSLHLIQFRAPLTPEQRQQIATNGVDLLHYIPDDTFIARFQNVSTATIQALPFVEWVGDYGARFKLHRALNSARTQARGQLVPANLSIAVVLAPRASVAEIADARKPFVSIQQQSTLRFGTVLRGKISATQLDALANSGAVLWVEPAPNMKLYDEVSSDIVAGEGALGELYTQSLGFDGSGVKVAVADSGLDNGDAETMHPDLLGRATNFMFYGSLTDASDEHGHGTHVAGIVAGNGATGELDENGYLYGLGVAPGAEIIAQRIFDGVGNYEAPPSHETLTRDAKEAGADIGSNSWGDDTQGRYDISAMEFDALVRDANALVFGDQPYILEFSAGNAGPGSQTIGSPAVAKNVIATGASDNARQDLFIYADGPDAMADFSSRGPSEDGRIKPDVVAPGTWIASLKSGSATDENAWSPIDDYYFYMGGTSQAGPHASGAAAVFVQYYREMITNTTPSPALVKAALINSAVDMDDEFGTAAVPNMDEGWGRIDLTQIIGSTRQYDFVDQTAPLQTGEVFERHIIVKDSDDTLKITLAYTDVPGFAGAIPALVNDLDIEVISPDGTQYRGNQFDGNGESIPNALTADRINNVEAVHLATPLPGEYIVRVRAHNVPEDARSDTGNVDQDFALVTSADLAPPGFGVIAMDKNFYRAPGLIKIFVADTDQAGAPSVNVTMRSTTEFSGENVTLLAAGTSGVFTGAVATATSPTIGALQIANGDLIETLYSDVSASVTRTATAHADFVAPVLTGVSVANDFGQAIISWSSDEPATSIVRYGTNIANLARAITNSSLTTDHSIAISGLVSGSTNYFYVVSADQAGNVGTNNNGGAMFNFVAAVTAPILLVDAYQDSTGFFGIPPLSGYTNALDAVGVRYDVWVTSERGSPANILKSFRVVLWRVSDFDTPWSSPEKTAIEDYLNSGGSLFVASMEVLTWVNDANFAKNVLHVDSFIDDEHGSTGAAEIIGAPNEAVGKNLDIAMDYSVYYDLWSIYVDFGVFPNPPDLSDTMTPSFDASPIFRNDVGDIVGLRWPGIGKTAPGRLVLCSFPLDAVPMESGVNDRINFVRNVLQFLAPGTGGIGTVAMDSSAYPLPGFANVEVGDTDLAGNGTVTVSAFSSTDPTGTNLTLLESVTPGVFTGSFQIISATNPPTAGKLRAHDGDTITVKYFDASRSLFVTATAMVDTNPPVISNVSDEPDYVQAVITWDTSEPADSLVQFGESSLLNRTTYKTALDVSHEVTLTGLAPNRTYYYRVISADSAGNTTVDDNGGTNYTFHTLIPLSPPVNENMETGAPGWTVQSADESQVVWTLGTPDNGATTNAHSPQNAWGTNLKGEATDQAETFLVSPAIDLTGGNTATLTFWHRHDFTDGESEFDIYEFGDLLIVTNTTISAVLLDEYTGASGGWVKKQVDLSPFIGQVVYLVWNYELFSFDTRVRSGWLVDDVSITVSNVAPGTIHITKNLWQPSYILTGPLNRTGRALDTLITNAPPGQYVVQFGGVPFYQTPATQINTLASGSNIVFAASYTFNDANTNSISDAWETNSFGNVSTNRTQFTDTDGDGASDYAEFIAGTDPNSASSKFQIATITLLGDGSVRLSWPSAIGHAYRIFGSSNLLNWDPVTGWIQAVFGATTYTLPPPAPGGPYLFRVEVQP